MEAQGWATPGQLRDVLRKWSCSAYARSATIDSGLDAKTARWSGEEAC